MHLHVIQERTKQEITLQPTSCLLVPVARQLLNCDALVVGSFLQKLK